MDITNNVPPVDNDSNEPADLQEEWRFIDDPRLVSQTRYQISNRGHIRNVESGKYKHPYIGKDGYARVSLAAPNWNTVIYLLHRLVALYFLPPPKEGQDCIDHIDGNPSNNDVDNLRWCSHKENTHNPITFVKMLDAVKEATKKNKIPVICEDAPDRVFDSAIEAAAYYGLEAENVRHSCRKGVPVGYGRWDPRPKRQFKFVPTDRVSPVVDKPLQKRYKQLANPVRCLENGHVYETVQKASVIYGLTPAGISHSCRQTAAGVPPKKAQGSRPVYHFEYISQEVFDQYMIEHPEYRQDC